MDKVLIVEDLKKFYIFPYIWILAITDTRRDGIFLIQLIRKYC